MKKNVESLFKEFGEKIATVESATLNNILFGDDSTVIAYLKTAIIENLPSDSSLIRKLIKLEKNATIRLAAIKRIRDLNELESILLNDSSLLVKLQVIEILQVNNKDELVHLLKDERIYEEASILNAILDILEQNQLLEIIKSPEFPIQVRIESMWRFNGIPELADLTKSGEKTIAKEAKYRIKELK